MMTSVHRRKQTEIYVGKVPVDISGEIHFPFLIVNSILNENKKKIKKLNKTILKEI